MRISISGLRSRRVLSILFDEAGNGPIRKSNNYQMRIVGKQQTPPSFWNSREQKKSHGSIPITGVRHKFQLYGFRIAGT